MDNIHIIDNNVICWDQNLFTWTIVSSASQKYTMRRNLEVNQSKPSASCSVFYRISYEIESAIKTNSE